MAFVADMYMRMVHSDYSFADLLVQLVNEHVIPMIRIDDAVLFFFFQAEDGIRDDLVTGVQTCALPISRPACRARHPRPPPANSLTRRVEGWRTDARTVPCRCRHDRRTDRRSAPWCPCRPATAAAASNRRRSEERRVGKECRSRWRPER